MSIFNKSQKIADLYPNVSELINKVYPSQLDLAKKYDNETAHMVSGEDVVMRLKNNIAQLDELTGRLTTVMSEVDGVIKRKY